MGFTKIHGNGSLLISNSGRQSGAEERTSQLTTRRLRGDYAESTQCPSYSPHGDRLRMDNYGICMNTMEYYRRRMEYHGICMVYYGICMEYYGMLWNTHGILWRICMEYYGMRMEYYGTWNTVEYAWILWNMSGILWNTMMGAKSGTEYADCTRLVRGEYADWWPIELKAELSSASEWQHPNENIIDT